MSQVICSHCFEVEDTTKRFIELPYVCSLCEESALALDQAVWETGYVGPACQQAAEEVHELYVDEEDETPCDAPYNSGVPCQSALDNVQSEQYAGYREALDSATLNQFDADTEPRNGLMAETEDLKERLSQANLDVQIQGEIIADLENQIVDLRLDICNVVFRTHF